MQGVDNMAYLGNMRPALRRTLGIIFLLISKVLIRSTVFCGVQHFIERLKKTDKLFILAPGASINQINQIDFQRISDYDSLGLNYFVFHEFIPTTYLIETHDTSRGYFEYVASNGLKFDKASILYKGYNSPSKIVEFVKNIKFLRKTNIGQFYLMKDAYCSDYKVDSEVSGICPNIKKTKDDFFYNDMISLIYVINLGYLCGYKDIILCGFDMSDDYFYCHTKYTDIVSKYSLCNDKSLVNKAASDSKKTSTILNRIQNLEVLFNERQGSIYQFKCNGRLAINLKKYEFK
jgi:hypothetical protein